MTRSPSTRYRLFLFFLALTGSWGLLLAGFPPGAPDRLPVLSLSLFLAFLTAQRPERGVVAFAFLFPCIGLFVRLFGTTDPATWPALLFGGLATGWTFRFIYDFESSPQPSSIDPWLEALLAVWVVSTVLAIARARTLWAVLHGLSGRAVNGQGLLDGEAIRQSIFSLSALAAGAAFYFLLRRSGSVVRQRASWAAVWGVAVSALAAIAQRLHALPAEIRPYWRLTGRLSGGSIDPNSLGLLCGLVVVVALTRGIRRRARGLDLIVAVVLLAGLLLSGSRSGFLLVFLSLLVIAVARGLPSRVRLAGVIALVGLPLLLALLVLRASPGTLASRMAESFDPRLSLEYRVSQRPVLWQAGLRLFLQHPIEGEGMGSFAWRLPDLLDPDHSLALRDNPGSVYVQALAETGLIGLVLTVAFAIALGSRAMMRVGSLESDPVAAISGVVLIAFLLACLFGSHWLAADVSLLFFLFASVVPTADGVGARHGPKSLRVIAVGIYVIAAAAGVLATNNPDKTFRYRSIIGFYEPEAGPLGPFRWTRKNFAMRVAAGESRQIRLTHRPALAQAVELTAQADGRVVYRATLAPNTSITLRIQGGALPRTVIFSLSRAFVPSRLRTGQDRRELGVQASIED